MPGEMSGEKVVPGPTRMKVDEGAVASAGLPSEILPSPAIVPADSELVNTGEVNGTQRWAAPDQSLVQYRAAGGTLTFHAWKRSYLIYWSMGASVTADGENYDAAIIDSNYYMTPPQGPTCEIVKVGQATDAGNNYFDEWQWGVNSQQPDRVASLCRAQWNGARFADLVTAGLGCPRYQNDQWPIGYPPSWPPLPAGVQVSPGSLSIHVQGLGLNAAASTAVLNHTASDVPVDVDPPATADFSWPGGSFAIPAYGQLPIEVMFGGGSSAGDYRTTMRIVAGGQEFTVPVIATVTATGLPK
jgi:hypothetical protein